jgi:thiamine kinase-like enzyme
MPVTAARSVSTPLRAAVPDPDDDLARVAAIAERTPGFAALPYIATKLAGGLTNSNYRLSVANRNAVVRLSSPQSALLAIDRDAEHANARAAAAAGVGPAVLGYFPDLGALVIDWVEGRTFEAGDLDDSATIAQVADTCRTLHAGPRFLGDFDMFALQRRYLDLVMTSGFRLPGGYLDYMPTVNEMRDAVAALAEPTVPCHNDLLAANIMVSEAKMWFIDFEYAGNGDPCFELGNLASESHLSVERLAELVTAYYGTESTAKLARARLFGLMSDYGWTLWASIQAATSNLDFDFWAWGMEKYERAREVFRAPGLAQLISDVRTP